ncbi:MAG TPA: V-type ATP synthase subunit D [Caldimonas sp.]|nr:V-type ATP synthase subunit D [Caldimonas sp.]
MTMAGPNKVTRSSLVRLARWRDQVAKGSALLEKRRDALVVELFARLRPGVDTRRLADRQAALAYRALLEALAAAGRTDLAALAWPHRELSAEAASGQPTPVLVRSAAARALVPGQYRAAAEAAAQAFERLLEVMLAAAPEEFAIRRLSRAIARTMRQVNVLEQRVSPDLNRTLVHVRRTLDEREREELVRLRRMAARGRGTLRSADQSPRSAPD